MLSPAHHTKHFPVLTHPFAASFFRLAQSDNGLSNGTALWLAAQCLSLYLMSKQPPKSGIPPRVVELGSGAKNRLALSALGYDVLATDTPHVISTVLARNIHANRTELPPSAGSIQIRELDWTVAPDLWTWDHPSIIASTSPAPPPPGPQDTTLRPPYDLICTADTVYTPALVEPLLRTLHALCTLSVTASGGARAPPVLLCVERRDPALVDRVLSEAKSVWGFGVDRVPHRKLAKAMERGGAKWAAEDWEGVEIWKLTLCTV